MSNPKVTVRDSAAQADQALTPSEELMNSPGEIKPETLTWEDGGKTRSLQVGRPSLLANLHMAKALGELAMNEAYMAQVEPLKYVKMIDGEPEPLPGSELEVEAMMEQLGEAGLTRLMIWHYSSVLAPQMEAMRSAVDAQKAAAKVKK